MNIVRWSLIAVAAVAVLVILVRLWVSRNPGTPVARGVENGRLATCPDSPNCVSTVDTTDYAQMASIPYEGETAVVQQRILQTIEQMPRTNVVTVEPTYIHVEFSTPTIGFVDDVEFLINEEAQQIEFRSASRLGYGDGGANRKRMEQFASLLKAQ